MSPRDLRCERGSALVEMAILTTIFVPILFASLYFSGLATAKLALQEASRRAVWEVAHDASTDYKTRQTEGALLTLRASLPGETIALLKERLETSQAEVAFALPQATVTLDNRPSGLLGFEANNGMGKVYGHILDFFGFNSRGKIEARVALSGKSRQGDIAFESRQTLLTDSWHLRDLEGIEVAQDMTCRSAFCHQIGRMSWLGIGGELQRLSIDSTVESLMALFGIHSPLTAVAVSRPLDNPADKSADSVAELKGPKLPSYFRPEKRHYTNVFREQFDTQRGPSWQAYHRRGPYYLGCPRSQRRESQCRP